MHPHIYDSEIHVTISEYAFWMSEQTQRDDATPVQCDHDVISLVALTDLLTAVRYAFWMSEQTHITSINAILTWIKVKTHNKHRPSDCNAWTILPF